MNVIGCATIPDHLPERMAVVMWGWYWLTYAQPDEAYGDLEKAMVESKERGFNCIRLDVVPDWRYDESGNRRSNVELKAFMPGYNQNMRCLNFKGNLKYDVHDRLMRLFKLAEKYDMYLALTTWEYHENTSILADDSIRRSIMDPTPEDFLFHLAKQHDKLINEIKALGLGNRIAYVELHNELDWFEIEPQQKRIVVESALSYLMEKHPDILFSADYSTIPEEEFWAHNSQLVDHHVYGLIMDFPKWDPIAGPDLNDPALRDLLKPDIIPWDQFRIIWEQFLGKAATKNEQTNDFFRRITWLYANLDNNRYDCRLYREFGGKVDTVREAMLQTVHRGAELGRKHALPVTLTEGYYLYPPFGSRFEESAAWRSVTEAVVHAAIDDGYWGITPTGYFAPDEPAWNEEPQKTYMMELCKQIRKGKSERLTGIIEH